MIGFSVILTILKQGRANGVSTRRLFEGIEFAVDSATNTGMKYERSTAYHALSGRKPVPTNLVESMYSISFKGFERGIQRCVLPLLKTGLYPNIAAAIKTMLENDTSIKDDYVIGFYGGPTKKDLLEKDVPLEYLLASVLRFSIVDVDNRNCQDTIKHLPKDFVLTACREKVVPMI